MSDPVLAPSKAIRAFCLDCTGGNDAEVRRCSARPGHPGVIDAGSCHVWPWRMGGKSDKSRAPKVPARGRCIRLECLNCMAGNRDAVKGCPSTGCALYPHRRGKNPNMARPGRGSANLYKFTRAFQERTQCDAATQPSKVEP